jgi:hypothetical protein
MTPKFRYPQRPVQRPGWAEEKAEAIRTVSASIEVFHYPAVGTRSPLRRCHTITTDAAQILWRRARRFCCDAAGSLARQPILPRCQGGQHPCETAAAAWYRRIQTPIVVPRAHQGLAEREETGAGPMFLLSGRHANGDLMACHLPSE